MNNEMEVIKRVREDLEKEFVKQNILTSFEIKNGDYFVFVNDEKFYETKLFMDWAFKVQIEKLIPQNIILNFAVDTNIKQGVLLNEKQYINYSVWNAFLNTELMPLMEAVTNNYGVKEEAFKFLWTNNTKESKKISGETKVLKSKIKTYLYDYSTQGFTVRKASAIKCNSSIVSFETKGLAA